MRRSKYFAIIGRHTKKVIGVCTDAGVSDVQTEEPGAQLIRIPKKLFAKFGLSCKENAGFDAEFSQKYGSLVK